MQKKNAFLSFDDHYELLVSKLAPRQRQLYEETRHARIEMGFRNRNFVVYEFERGAPRVVDLIEVADFDCSDLDGASIKLRSKNSRRELVISYQPTQLFDYHVFISLPLSMSLQWQINQSQKTQLRFPMYVRTTSRTSLREAGVTYFEPAATYYNEFGTVDA